MNVEEVMRKTREIQRERMETAARAATHMSDCPIDRGGDCACPAQLFQAAEPKEVKEVGKHLFWRMDDGHEALVWKPHPSFPRERIQMTEFIRPLWVCRSCGWSMRAMEVGAHDCDPSRLLFKERPVPLSRLVDRERRFRGDVLVTIRRGDDGCYYVGELLRDGEVVVSETVLLADHDYRAVEGVLTRVVSETFQP